VEGIVYEFGAASQADPSTSLGALVEQSTPQGEALGRLAEAVREFAQAVQSAALPLQVRVHVFCDPRGRPAGPALDVTCQALGRGHLQQVGLAGGSWEEQKRVHGWSPGQLPWDVGSRTPGEYPSLVSRVEQAGMNIVVRLEGDADFYQAPPPPAISSPETVPPQPEPEFDANSWMATFLASQPAPPEENP
jgi:hypothetical protein